MAETLQEEGKDDGFMSETLDTQTGSMWQMLGDVGFIEPSDAPSHASSDAS